MIGAGEISKRAGVAGVDARTVERDYMLTHVAVGISEQATASLVLKGGTSLRLAHFADYRFSADLDHSAVDVDLNQAIGLVRSSLAVTRERVGLSHLELLDNPGGRPLFEAKARRKEILPTRFFVVWKEREPLYRQGWASELASYIGPAAPDVETVMRQMNRRVAELSNAVNRSR